MSKLWRCVRWTMLLGAGGILLQVPSCIEIIDTAILAFIGGVTYYIARQA